MKTKDRHWKLANEAGISMKTNNLADNNGNLIEKKGS
jgi:hypothetical protein